MNRKPILTVAAFAAITAGVLLGDQEFPLDPPDPPIWLSQEFYSPLRNATFGRVVAAEFTGDDSLDAVVMDGTTPKLLISPEIYDTAISVETGGTPVVANDIAVIAHPAFDRDFLLTVGPDGLQRWKRNVGSWSVATLRSGSTPWDDAALVRVGDLDGSGLSDIVGIGLDSTTGLPTRVLVEQAASDMYSHSAFDCVGEAYDLHLIDWDADTGSGDTTDEIAVVTDLGVEVYEADGSYVASFSWTTSTIVSAVIDNTEVGAERLAMVLDSGGGNQDVTVFGENGTESPMAIGAPGAVAASTGDLDGDGDEDLLLSITAEEKFWVLWNQSPSSPSSSSTTFSSTISTYAFGVPRAETSNTAGIATGDFDMDGDIDVLPPAQGTGSARSEAKVYRSDVVDGTLFRPELGATSFDPQSQTLTLPIDESSSGIPGYATGNFAFEASLWHTSDIAEPTDTQAYASAVVTGASWQVVMPGTYDPVNDPDIYSIVVRQVVLDGSSEILARGPATTGIVTPVPLWQSILVAEEIEQPLQGDPTGEDPTLIGVGPRPPGFEEEEEPDRGA